MTSLLTEPINGILDRLHTASLRDDELDIPSLPSDASAQHRADALASAYMPVSAHGGRLLYNLTRFARPRTIVEFGTSYGISTLYLAAAVRDNGRGRVVTTELSSTKVAAARANLAEAGVAELVDVLAGDALRTLGTIDEPIGLVLLDGWKDLYLPVLRLLEPRLTPGALVIGDDSSFASVQPYLDHVRDPANGYLSVSFPVEDGMEISCRLAG
ncbi:class I SAM-dependent methyltransferase [Paractinoplanes ferrugineus]|uniref:O-methyltransferase, family 3 n=1 Tax=Paractinoplanes ferrugineus TaxID=113564 RepID=A0A919J7P3_9ACTN|nr:class I SAM-dependent methyltransferase [Actinoplanes ferrugineus]GIE16376.1 putative O-methyltransferase, family 3 [Actinoplanes ferrugineus]